MPNLLSSLSECFGFSQIIKSLFLIVLIARKEMSPKLRKANPGLKQPQIMKLIAEEWRKMPIPETD